MPQTLEVMAKLHKYAPGNTKVLSYVVNCYLEYGYPEKALAYYKSIAPTIDSRYSFSIVRDLFYSLLKGEDENAVLFTLDEIKKMYMGNEDFYPSVISSFMNFKANYVNYIATIKKDPKRAIEVGNADLKWFDENVEALKDSPNWTPKKGRYPDGYKEYVQKIVFPSSKMKHLLYISQAALNVEGEEHRIAQMLELCKYLETVEIQEYRTDFYKYLQSSYGYSYISSIYSKLGDEENKNKYSDLSKEFRAKYINANNEYRAAMKKKAEEAAAKRKAEEEAKKAAEEKRNEENKEGEK